MQFSNGQESNAVYNNVNHYLSPKFWAYIGKDFASPNNYNGQIGHFNINLGLGAFRDGKDLAHKDDVFGLVIGTQKLVP